MRLEHLFDCEMRYTDSAWLERFAGGESSGFGIGDGMLTGPHLAGRLLWSNQPRMRADGVWLPDVFGSVNTDDGATVLIHFTGYSVVEDAPGTKRSILASLTFRASDDRYRWLNYVLGVAEGENDEETETVRLRAYACLSELASGPPRIDDARGGPFASPA